MKTTKNISSLLWFFFIPLVLSAQLTQISPCTDYDIPVSLVAPILLPSGNTIFFTTETIPPATYADYPVANIVMLKIAPDGTCLDNHYFLWDTDAYPFDNYLNETPIAAIYSAGDIYLACELIDPSNTDATEVGLIKVDTAGQVRFRSILSSSTSFNFHHVRDNLVQLPNGNIVIPFNWFSLGGSLGKYVIADGTTGEQLHVGSAASWLHNHVSVASDTSFFLYTLVGHFYEIHSETYEVLVSNSFVLPVNSNYLPGDAPYIEKNEEGYLIFASIGGPNAPPSSLLVLQIDEQGEALWHKVFPEVGIAIDVEKMQDGGYMIAHHIDGSNFENDMAISHLDALFTLERYQAIKLEPSTTCTGIMTAPDGAPVIAGYSRYAGGGYPFFLEVDSLCCFPPEISFQASSTSNNEMNYIIRGFFAFPYDSTTQVIWDFGNGDSLISDADNSWFIYEYDTQGQYDISVEVITPCGSATFKQAIYAYCGHDGAPFSFSVVDNTVDFQNLLGNLTSILWNFGDGSGSTENAPTHSYSMEGVYEVCLSGENDCGIFTYCDSVEVLCPAVPPFDLGGQLLFCPGDSLFLEGPQGLAAYAWSTGSTDANIWISQPGDYQLTATNACGSSSSDSVSLSHYMITIPVISFDTMNPSLLMTIPANSYQWYLDGLPIPGAMDASYTVLENGIYSVEIRDQNNCLLYSEGIFVGINTLANLPESTPRFSFSPNPTRGTGQLRLELPQPARVQVKLRDYQGRFLATLSNKQWLASHQTQYLSLQMPDLANGIYFMEIEIDNNSYFTKINFLNPF